jgi:SHS2 domain-containing protein
VGRYRVLEEVAVADCALEIEGNSLDDLFETGALALCELMVDPATVAPGVERTVSLVARTVDLLFFDWLSELIYLKDTNGEVFTRSTVRVARGRPCRLAATLHGGIIDRGRTALRADPKAVTFHEFMVEPATRGWRARIIIDL